MTDKSAFDPSGLKQFANFEGGVEDLALAADSVLASLGALTGDEGAASVNPRLIRDYTQRGILSRPERLGKEALYRYQHLVELVAARILLNDVDKYTLMVGLQIFTAGQFDKKWGVFAAGALIGALPIMITYLALQDQIAGGLTAGAVKE